MKNASGEVIYVGKAKSLKNRMSSYFTNPAAQGEKVAAMASNIADFDIIVCDSEFEALVLECSLIKQYMPKYNILLKDDKGYPLIRITSEKYPRVMLARKKTDKKSKYFGPYKNARIVGEIIDDLSRIFGIYTCKRRFPVNIGVGRACLNYHIGKCAGVCTGEISEQEYGDIIKNVELYLSGKNEVLRRELVLLMEEAASNEEFERAAKIRDRIAHLDKAAQRQKVSNSKGNFDALGFCKGDYESCVSVLKIRDGVLRHKESKFFDNFDAQDKGEMLSQFLGVYYFKGDFIPDTVYVPFEVEDMGLYSELISSFRGKKVSIAVPKRGEKAEFVSMADKNATYELSMRVEGKNAAARVTEALGKKLKTEKPPRRIEAYDISNLGSDVIVGAACVFEDGVPVKKDYKKFNIRGFESPDDYGSMREMLNRRFLRELNSDSGFSKLPDVIFIDGGEQHMRVAENVLKELGLSIPVFGMVKDDTHKTRALIAPFGEIEITDNMALYNFVCRIQEETHRFAIEHNRKRSGKRVKKSSLMDISGIGRATASALLKEFKSITNIKSKSAQELARVKRVTQRQAEAVFDYFHRGEQ